MKTVKRHVISIDFSADDIKRLTEDAKRCGIKRSTYIRLLVQSQYLPDKLVRLVKRREECLRSKTKSR